ncbi:hypothetical protein KJ855_03370 [Patescibacteria group bacterium]|nr:hypothetical protein [Patescibacteria group bacterium]
MENKVCKQCSADYVVEDEDLVFYDKISPEFSGKKYKIPVPTLCPDCRLRRRLCWRNLRSLYRRKSDKSGQDLLAIYAPNKPYKVWHVAEIQSDDFDAFKYGRDYDLSRGFFDQFNELFIEVPKAHAYINFGAMENAEFVNGASDLKNAYYSFSLNFSDGVYYSDQVYYSQDIYDCMYVRQSENCFQSVECTKVYNAFYCRSCNNCRDIMFSTELTGCQDCFGCVGLQNKQYCIFNEQKTKEEYERFVAGFEFKREKVEEVQQRVKQIYLGLPHKYADNLNTENSVGDWLKNTRNCQNCFEMTGADNVKNGFICSADLSDSQDISFGFNGVELAYETMIFGFGSYVNAFCWYCIGGRDIYYCAECSGGTKDCFGCVGLRNGEYCILNKQYTKEEYEQLVPKIIEKMEADGEWGEFFPMSISPFGYNETMGQDYMPMTKEEAIGVGATWQMQDFGLQYDGEFYESKDISTYDPEANPRAQGELGELLAGVLKCEVTGKPFRLISQEVAFYIEHGLPIPTKHPDQRYRERFEMGRPRKLFDRQCDKCGKEIKSTFDEKREEIVYCERCYHELR